MPERDWAIDFAICFNNPKHKEISTIACYWLQRARELEEQVEKLENENSCLRERIRHLETIAHNLLRPPRFAREEWEEW